MTPVVLFDIDGTLIHTHGAGRRAFAEVLGSQFGLPDATRGVSFAGRTDRDICGEIFRAHHLPDSAWDVFAARYLQQLQSALQHRAGEVLPGVAELIRGLEELPQRPKLALLTGNLEKGAELKLRSVGLWRHFAFGAYGDQWTDRDDVAREALSIAQAHCGVAADHLLVIGDTPRDIQCARAIGARVLAVATGECTLEELARHEPDALLPDLTHTDALRLMGLLTPEGS